MLATHTTLKEVGSIHSRIGSKVYKCNFFQLDTLMSEIPLNLAIVPLQLALVSFLEKPFTFIGIWFVLFLRESFLGHLPFPFFFQSFLRLNLEDFIPLDSATKALAVVLSPTSCSSSSSTCCAALEKVFYALIMGQVNLQMFLTIGKGPDHCLNLLLIR